MKKHEFHPVNPNVAFPELEREILVDWYQSGLVDKYLHKNDKSKKNYSFLDGPITANNPMGVHHAWGRTFKDLWQRYHNMKGEKQRFQNGFDCQGLWVEVEVEKELDFRTKKDIEAFGVANFVNKCKERVLKYSTIQTEQSKRLGYFMDWNNSYFTMSDENNYTIWLFLKTCWERGWIYKGHDSVPWCPRCETAISQHEMLTEDYKEVTHKAIYFALPITGHANEYLLVWTTTPWTLPANIAVAVDKDLNYLLIPKNGKNYWIVEGREKEILGGEADKAVKKVKGRELAGLKYRGPFDTLSKVKKVAGDNPDKFHTVVVTDPMLMPITTTEGTGLVHTAVSAGTEDFQLGKKLGLPMIPVIADNADYLPDMDFLSGQNAKKHPEVILDYLTAQSTEETPWVYKIENYTHRYPACWRCKTELVWKVADEWYIAMDMEDPTDKKKRSLREEMIDVAKKISWRPGFGLDRELDWLKNMHDWLISKKNRYWGLALPIFDCPACGTFEVIGSKEELKDRSVEGWEKFEGNSPHKPWIDDVKIKCSKCQKEVSRIPDVGNPWLDAGIVSFSTLNYRTDKKYWEQWFPADFITESFPGQFKNWFYALIAMSTVLTRENPFRNVLGFGTLFGEDGRPMHKSWGNSIDFNEGADKIGVDVMRWMYVTHRPEENLLFGYKIADETRRRFHLILWNTYNFFLSYAMLDKISPEKLLVTKLPENDLDRWILSRLAGTAGEVGRGLDGYDAYAASLSLSQFVDDFSTWYIRRSRDRIGPSAPEGADKLSCYRTAYTVLLNLTKLLAPFIPFMTEEIYRNLTGGESVHLESWPELPADWQNTSLEKEMAVLRKIAEQGHAQRKENGLKVRQPLAKAEIKLKPDMNIKSVQLLELLKSELNIKVVIISKGENELPEVTLDRNITSELAAEGKAREIVRAVQEARKAAGCGLSEKISLVLPEWPEAFEDYIKKETLAGNIISGPELKITRG